jgi:hypothetical protein
MRGAIPPLSHTRSWRGAQLKKHGDNFTFAFFTILYWLTLRFGLCTLYDGLYYYFVCIYCILIYINNLSVYTLY